MPRLSSIVHSDSLPAPSFYDAIITDPPYNVKESVQVTGAQHCNSTTVSTAAESTTEYPREKLDHGARKQGDHFIRDSAFSGDNSNQFSEIGRTFMQHERTEASSPTPVRPTSEESNRRASGDCSDVPDAATVVAEANRLVGEVVLSLLSVARYALKPGGRLVFFLPLRDEDARRDELPSAVREKLEERSVGQGDEGAGGTQLSIVYAAKQLLTSPNLCRWLIVLEKEGV